MPRGSRGHWRGEGTTGHAPCDSSWAFALCGGGLGAVKSSVARLPGSICTGGNKQPNNSDRRGTSLS